MKEEIKVGDRVGNRATYSYFLDLGTPGTVLSSSVFDGRTFFWVKFDGDEKINTVWEENLIHAEVPVTFEVNDQQYKESLKDPCPPELFARCVWELDMISKGTDIIDLDRLWITERKKQGFL